MFTQMPPRMSKFELLVFIHSSTSGTVLCMDLAEQSKQVEKHTVERSRCEL